MRRAVAGHARLLVMRTAVGLAVAVALATVAVIPGRLTTRAASPVPSASTSVVASPLPSPGLVASANKGLCGLLNVKVPGTIAGLPVTQEAVCETLSQTTRLPAINALNLYSVRRPDKVLIATLEVARLKADVDPGASGVQSSIAGQVGDSSPEKLRVGDRFIYISQAKGITLMTWFRGHNVLVLAVRDIFDHPRAMLREALGIG